MQNKKIRWGIIGAGNIAKDFVKDFPLLQNAELVAIAASDKGRANAFAIAHKIPLAYTYEELYNSNEIDAVYIATTHNFHFEQSIQSMQHGKAVLCEKPITINDTEFKEMAALSKEKNIFLMEAMWTYFLPAIQKAQQWIAEGRIGKLKVIQADFSFALEKNLEGRMYNPNLAGGALLDLGVYPVAAATLFANSKPNSITANGVLTETGVDANTAMILQYDNITATLFTTMEVRMTNKLRLFGDDGYIEIPDFWRGYGCKLFNKDFILVESFDDERKSHGFIYQMQHATNRMLHNEIESDIMTHKRSNIIQEIMTEARRQMGFTYPNENQSKITTTLQ
jgi:predicted dehydrogenase